MLKEYTTPLKESIDADKNVFDLLADRAQRTPEQTIVAYRGSDGEWTGFTATQFRDLVVAIAKGLIAKGLMPGDSVGILAHTSWQWTALDFAIMSIGCVTVPIYETDSALQIRSICNDSTISYVFAEDDEQRDKVESVKDECPTLKGVYVMQLGAIDAMVELGKGVGDEEFLERETATHGDMLATIVYTSGSTGTPKGVELTHANFVYCVQSGFQTLPEITYEPGNRLVLFLPLAHVFARYMQFLCIGGNNVVALTSNFKTIIKDFQEFRPTYILYVPRVFEKVYNAATQRAGSGFKGRVFAKAAVAAYQWSVTQQEGRKPSPALRAKHALYSKLVYSQLLEVFGGARCAISGGAPISRKLAHFFNGIGLPLLEGYGMTETCAPCAVNTFNAFRIGTIGRPFCGMSFAIADDGEVCIKSPSVCRGYHNHPELTHEQIQDGWLHTGDLGDIDDEGFVRLTGRKKDLIITAGGKNVSPEKLESQIVTSPLIDHCLMVGDRKPFIAAIVTLDLEGVNTWLVSQGGRPCESLEEAAKSPLVYSEVDRVINEANENVSRAESIRKFEIVPDEWNVDNGMLTPSLKTRRAVITKHYKDFIDQVIYAPKKK